jgi:hypothetical protein
MQDKTMKALVKSDDAVLVSFITSLLKEAGIEAHVFDRHASALQGAVGQAPERIMVASDEWERARRLLDDAGLGHWITSVGEP